MNVVGSRPDGWWRDRRAAMTRLVDDLEAYAAATGERVNVMFDGRAFPIERSLVEVGFAESSRPNAADDAIVEHLETGRLGPAPTVVTSDAALAERVRALGAEVIGAGAFRRRLEAAADAPPRD
jgi:predicted RNA-binding protein with PIN domain